MAGAIPARAEPPWSVLRNDATVTLPANLRPDTIVRTLTVAVEPNPMPASGNGAYFDIGPLAMKLCARDRAAPPCTMPVTTGLTVRDLLWFRLHKTGKFDLDGAPGIDWYVGSITVTVNGTPLGPVAVNQSLGQHHPVWLGRITTKSDAETVFMSALSRRCNAHAVNAFAQGAGFLSTPLFKLRGVSGWKNTGVPYTHVYGVVYREPARSTDGLATIDVAVGPEESRTFDPNPEHYRFIRVEYLWQGRRTPHRADRVYVSGPVVWDTDGEGWFELHPTEASEVRWYDATPSSTALVDSLRLWPECR